MKIPHLRLSQYAQPAIILMGLIAGFGIPDVWMFIAALLAAWFIEAEPWDPYEIDDDRRKSNYRSD
jgi:hypothetical protein